MNQLFEFNSGFFHVVSLYVQTFGVFKLKTSLLPTVAHSTVAVVQEISALNAAVQKHAEKVTAFGAEKDRLKRFLDAFSRNLCWFIGMTSFKLIKVKEEKEQDKKEAKETEKM